MSITFTLTDLVIRQINIDYARSCVIVIYDRVDNNGKVWDTGEATFWATLPEEQNPNWFQLPTEYITLLLSMRNDADTVLTAAFLT